MSTYDDVEHRQLEGALAEVVQLARQGNFLGAGHCFVEFRRAVKAHLDQEQTFSLPEFRQRTGDPHRVVPILEAQHRELERGLDRVSAALATADEALLCAALLELDALLSAHQAAEELLLSPTEPDLYVSP